MKKNRLSLLAAAACALLLSACSTELSTTDNPNYAGAGEAILSVSLQFPQADKPAGYAPGDVGDIVPPDVALDAEKEIKSIAFIVFTADAKGVFLSGNPTLTPNGFLEPLTPVKDAPIGNYTAKFKIQSDDFSGKTTIIAIANYKEYNLTFDPDNLSIAAIKAMLTPKLEADQSLHCPLLMSVATETDITDGGYPVIDFKMERLMARVDVVNNAFDKTTPANNFKLTSARLIRATSQGTMIGGQTIAAPTYVNTALETTVTPIDPAADAPQGTPSKEQLNPIYVYENSNKKPDDGSLSDQATAIEVNGTYQGKAYSKVIDFVTAQKVVGDALQGGDVVSIERNTRYVVEISSSKEQELVFDVKVKDWDEGTDLEVGIDFKEPVLEGLEQDITLPNGTTWTAATKTLNITKANAPSVFEFIVRGFQDTDFKVEKEYDENAAPLRNVIDVQRGPLGMTGTTRAGDATEGDEAPLVRKYTVTIPPYTEEYPSLTKIVVYNAAADGSKTEINVKYAPFFMTDIKSSQADAAIDPVTRLIDLKGVANGQTGTVSFFASANAALETSIIKKGLTDNFYTVTSTDEEPENAITKKYGPGKRVTLSYSPLTDSPELAEVNVKETGALDATAKKLYVKCFKRACFESVGSFSPHKENALVDANDPKKIYLAVNDGAHGTIDYTVYDDVAKNSFTPAATATYAATTTTPSWVQDGIKTISVGENLEVVSDEFQIVKRVIQFSLPIAIKNPASATNLKVGMLGEPDNSISLIPVYPSAYNAVDGTSGSITAADKAFAPVCVKGVWWAPLNIGQTKISTINNPSSEGGNIFQWGRKRALTWGSSPFTGPVAPTAPEVIQDMFITASSDWCNAPNNKFWNSGTDTAPSKANNDPCPAGWRVPTKDEWANSIVGGDHEWQASSPSDAQNGLLTVTGEGNAKLYFPAAGLRNYDGSVGNQGTSGYYWASAGNSTDASNAVFSSATVSANNFYRANGMAVRCVQVP